ncbi:MAG: ornithine carbamoyltransferase [Candidatus Aenigmatarchaeota archaeon]|nr:ornithine carbamoyltransferase [Candidatus Aenigmarchaeota archaeon]
MKHLLSMNDLSKVDIEKIFRLTDKLKNKQTNDLKGKNIALIFQKPSTRTRVSFTVAINQLGGNAITLNWNELQLGRGETVEDTTRVLERYVDAIVARVFSHEDLVKMAKISKVPVINALSDLEHPCQALADLYTIKQKKKNLRRLKIVFLGDGANNTFHSLILACEKFGLDIVVSCPNNYRPKVRAKYKIIEDPKEAVKDADILYTDVFVSMGQETEQEKRLKELQKYQLNSKLVELAKKDVIVLHPLPAHRGQEITSDVIDGENSVVFDQAENRLHTEKAILYLLMK